MGAPNGDSEGSMNPLASKSANCFLHSSSSRTDKRYVEKNGGGASGFVNGMRWSTPGLNGGMEAVGIPRRTSLCSNMASRIFCRSSCVVHAGSLSSLDVCQTWHRVHH